MKEEAGWDVYAVGDCVKVGNRFHAIQAAFQLARSM